jgi:phosphatidylethanolamine-binding protein
MTVDFTFGPELDQWTYDRSSKTYDLTRNSTSTLSFATTQGLDGVNVRIDPGKTALVVVDMQNFFLHPSCRTHPPGLEAVTPTIDVIAKCRELGIQAWAIKCVA